MSKRDPEMKSAFWAVAGTSEFGNDKEELKKIRAQLNKDAGIDEKDKDVNPNNWKFKITKAPGHPRYSK